jgi:hypothetical protein
MICKSRFAAVICGLVPSFASLLAGVPLAPSGDEILSKVEAVNNRRHLLLKEYSGSRQYTLESPRFGKQAVVAVLMNYRQADGERYTVLTRSGSEKLGGIIDKVLASETGASLPGVNARHEITSANYRVRLLGTEAVAGRTCYILDLAPKIKNRFLIVGKAWVDAGSYAVVRIEGQFAASLSLLLGAPHISEEFVEVRGFWLPGHVRSVTSGLLLGPIELDILFSNYQLDQYQGHLTGLSGNGTDIHVCRDGPESVPALVGQAIASCGLLERACGPRIFMKKGSIQRAWQDRSATERGRCGSGAVETVGLFDPEQVRLA